MKKFLGSAFTVAAVMALSSVAFAADGETAMAAGSHDPNAYKMFIPLGIGLTLGLAAFGSAFGQGKAATAALEGIARNPAAAGKIQVPMILALAFMEALTIFSWLIASTLAGRM